jgi:hypothetical protein
MDVGVSNAVVALSNYIGNQGTGTTSPSDGLFLVDLELRSKDITDGISSTILIGERCSADVSSTGLGGASIWTGATVTLTGDCRPSLPSECGVGLASSSRFSINRGEVYFGGSGFRPFQAFTSLHRSSSQFGFCDGSVHNVSENIDSRIEAQQNYSNIGTFQKLTSRNDGQVIGEY